MLCMLLLCKRHLLKVVISIILGVKYISRDICPCPSKNPVCPTLCVMLIACSTPYDYTVSSNLFTDGMARRKTIMF